MLSSPTVTTYGISATFELGANDYITVFVPKIVLSKVNNVLASHRRYLTVELEAQKLKVRSELDRVLGLYNKNTVEYLIHENLKKCAGGTKCNVCLLRY